MASRSVVLAVAAGLVVGAALGMYAGSRVSPAAQPGSGGSAGADGVRQLQAQLAEARDQVARLQAEVERLQKEGQDPSQAGAAERAARALALVAYRALAEGDGRALALLNPDPAEVELHVPAGGEIRYATLEEADALAAMAAWVRERQPPALPGVQYVPDPHAPEADGYHNAIVELREGFLFVQFDGDWRLVKVAATTEAPEFD